MGVAVCRFADCLLSAVECITMRMEEQLYSGPSSTGSIHFLLERHLAQVAWSLSVLNLICIPQSTHALDQGGVEPRQAVSPRPGGQERYRFATASVLQLDQYIGATIPTSTSCSRGETCVAQLLPT